MCVYSWVTLLLFVSFHLNYLLGYLYYIGIFVVQKKAYYAKQLQLQQKV